MEPLFCFVFYLPLPSRSQVRVSQEQEHFLLNPFGLLYSEVTASSLIKVDMQVRIYLKPANACRRAYAKSSACDAEFDRFFFFLPFFFYRAMWSTREQRTLESTLPVSSSIRPSMPHARTPNASSTFTIPLASLWVMIDERNCRDILKPSNVASFLIGILSCQVSALKCGFLPVSQESVMIGEVSYHDYYGILVDPEERDTIARNLGPLNKVRLAHTL